MVSLVSFQGALGCLAAGPLNLDAVGEEDNKEDGGDDKASLPAGLVCSPPDLWVERESSCQSPPFDA